MVAARIFSLIDTFMRMCSSSLYRFMIEFLIKFSINMMIKDRSWTEDKIIEFREENVVGCVHSTKNDICIVAYYEKFCKKMRIFSAETFRMKNAGA